MSINSHLDIIEALANGTDPSTGEVLPSESPYNNPDVIRALFAAINHINNPQPKVKKSLEQKQSDNVKNGLPKNAGLPWTVEQRDEMAFQFKSKKSIDDLAEIHERTKGAITSELKKQGLIEE